MNFRQTFSFFKKRLELKTKDKIGFKGTIASMVSLPDGSIIFAGAINCFTNSEGIDYPRFNSNRYTLIKIMPNGEIDQNFINNMGTGFSGGITQIATDGTDLYVVGGFASFNGDYSNARGIAKLSILGVFDTTFSDNLDVVAGVKNSNTSGFNSVVYSISLDNDSLYIGGGFTGFKGVSYNASGIAKLSKSGVFDTSFSNNLDVVPGTKDNNTSGFLDGAVYDICRVNDDLYVGGAFTRFKSTQANARRIAKLSIVGAFDTTFSDNLDVVPGTKDVITSGFNNPVRKIVSDENSLYVVGDFTKIKSNTSSPSNAGGVAKLSMSGVFDTAFSDNLDIVSGTKTFSSGFKTPTGFATLYDIMLDGTDIYVGGNMSSFKGIASNARGIAKLSTSGVFDISFSNNLDVVSGIKNLNSGFNISAYQVTTIYQHDNSLYLGGNFTSFKDSPSVSIQKISKLGISENFIESREGFNQELSAIVTDGDGNRYVGGPYNISGLSYNGRIVGNIAKILPNGVLDEDFSNNIGSIGFNNHIKDMLIIGNNLYVVGNFTSFNGISNNAKGIAKLSTSGVFDQSFSDNLDVVPGVKGLATSGFDVTSPYTGVNTIATDGDNLYVGGGFNRFKDNGYNARRIAKLSTSGVFDTAFSNNLDVVAGVKDGSTSGFDDPVRKIIVSGSDLYVGGDMSRFKSTEYNAHGIAKLSTSGVFDQSFSDNLDEVSGTKTITSGFGRLVYDICKDGTSLYVVGGFVRFKTSGFYNANGIAKLSTSGVFDTAFSNNLDVVAGFKTNTSGFGANNTLYSIFILKNNIFVGGDINSYKGILYNARGIAKLSTSGILDTAFSNYLDLVPGVKDLSSGGLYPQRIIYDSKYNSIITLPKIRIFKDQIVDWLFSISYMD